LIDLAIVSHNNIGALKRTVDWLASPDAEAVGAVFLVDSSGYCSRSVRE